MIAMMHDLALVSSFELDGLSRHGSNNGMALSKFFCIGFWTKR